MKCIHYALNKWEHFIYGSPEKAIVYTDMIELTAPKYLNKTNCRLLLSWSMKLSEFNFELRHVKGEHNDLADLLSRAPSGSEDMWDHWVSVIKTQEKASKTINIIQEVLLSTPIVEDEPTKVEDSIVHPVGTFENPLPISLSHNSHVLIRHLADASLAKVRRWLLKGVRPPATEASGLDATTRCYY